MRSLPWVRELHQEYGPRGLRIIGVHSPEFDYERDPHRVRREIERHDLAYANVIDNDMEYWARLNNRYWPTFYLADKQGRIRLTHIGETHPGTETAREVERMIETLLAE